MLAIFETVQKWPSVVIRLFVTDHVGRISLSVVAAMTYHEKEIAIVQHQATRDELSSWVWPSHTEIRVKRTKFMFLGENSPTFLQV